MADDKAEIGFWIGVPYWEQGLISEAVHEILRHGFEDMGLKSILSGYFKGNEKSKHALENLCITIPKK
ncbi:MAG: GNAT family N-acetyltransferase [Methanobrevibacter sp.]|nr:GNAT family N-acetyltransferase [Methanobrevibacter sp.]